MKGRSCIPRAVRKDDRQHVAEIASVDEWIITVDPGARGMALLFEPVKRWGDEPPAPIVDVAFSNYKGGHALAGALDVVSADVDRELTVVMEESFGGGRMNVQSELASALYAGAVICASENGIGSGFNVVMVRPAVWIDARS